MFHQRDPTAIIKQQQAQEEQETEDHVTRILSEGNMAGGRKEISLTAEGKMQENIIDFPFSLGPWGESWKS